MSVCSVSVGLPVQRVNVHQKLKHRRAFTEPAQGTIWNGSCYRAGFWAGIAKHQLCKISLVLPEEVPGQLSEKCSPSRQGRQAAGSSLESGSGTGSSPTPHLPGFCHTASEAGWLLGITCGRSVDGSYKPIRVGTVLPNHPNCGSTQPWKRHTAEFFEVSDIHQSIRMLWKFLTSRDLFADLINIIKLRLK